MDGKAEGVTMAKALRLGITNKISLTLTLNKKRTNGASGRIRKNTTNIFYAPQQQVSFWKVKF